MRPSAVIVGRKPTRVESRIDIKAGNQTGTWAPSLAMGVIDAREIEQHR